MGLQGTEVYLSEYVGIRWLKEHNTLNIKFLSEHFDTDAAQDYINAFFDFTKRNSEISSFCTLTDVSCVKKVTREARKISLEAIKSPKTGRSALFGLNPLTRAAMKFVMIAAGKRDTTVCTTYDEGLEWIIQGQK